MAKTSKVKNMTASGLVKTGAGAIKEIIINSHTSGTLKLWNALTATGTVLNNTITLGSGERYIPFAYGEFTTGLYITIGGTADISVYYE